jgi:hypothetical protein
MEWSEECEDKLVNLWVQYPCCTILAANRIVTEMRKKKQLNKGKACHHQSPARSHQKTRRNWEQLDGTDSEMFRTRRLDEKLTKSVVHQLPRIADPFPPKHWLATAGDGTERNRTVLLRRVAWWERVYDAKELKSSVPSRLSV